MSSERLILVTGATGRQGGAVARRLLAAGFGVRALTRDRSKPAALALQERGAEIAEGDMDDPASLRRAAAGAHGVFSVQNYWEKGVGYEGEVRQGRHLADAAREAGAAHFVQASIADAERAPGVEHFASKAEIEGYVDRLGLPRTFVGEVFFMENLFDPKMGPLLFPVLAGSLRPQTRLHLISVDDIGGIVAHVFQHPEAFIGRKVDVAGDRLTVDEMRRAYERVTGKKAKGWRLPPFVMGLLSREALRQFRWNNDPGWQFDPAETRRLYPEATSFEGFLERHRAQL